MRHTHRDPNRLTFACDACILRVQRDDFAHELRHLPLEHLLDVLYGRGYLPEWKRVMAEAEIAGRAA